MADVARDDDAHAVAGVFDKAAYLMMNDPTTRAVSDDTWAKVFYNSLYRLGQGARFIDARAAVLSSAKSLGLTNSELIAIQDAFDEVGITESRKVRIVLRWGLLAQRLGFPSDRSDDNGWAIPCLLRQPVLRRKRKVLRRPGL